MEKYKVFGEVPNAVAGATTVQDLQRWLNTNPMPGYRLVSCQLVDGSFMTVWELI